MAHPNDTFRAFLRAVHRRQVVLRIVEGAALGTLGACAVAVVLVGAMVWRGQDAWAVAGVTLLVGAIAGATWGAVTRPSLLASAGEADRQLRTCDLFGTAWAIAAQSFGADQPFQHTVLALAAERCRALSPSGVVLRRLGVRAWGGVALAVAFVATLAAMASEPLRAGTRETAARGSESAARDVVAPRPIVATGAGDARQARRERSPDEDRAIGSVESQPNDDVDDAKPPDGEARKSHARNDGADGAGAGTASTNDRRGPDVREATTPAASDAVQPSSLGKQGTVGTGRAATGNPSAEPAGGGRVTGPTPSLPWQPPAWLGAVEAAGQDVRAGRVPDAHRDLVRGYFDRTDSRR